MLFPFFCKVFEFRGYLRIFVAKETASFSCLFRPVSSDFIAIIYFLRKKNLSSKYSTVDIPTWVKILGKHIWRNIYEYYGKSQIIKKMYSGLKKFKLPYFFKLVQSLHVTSIKCLETDEYSEGTLKGLTTGFLVRLFFS